MSDNYFPEILLACWDDDDPDIKQKAIATIQQLTKTDENRPLLYRWGVLQLLVHIICTKNTESTYRHAVVSLYRLVSNKDKRKLKIVRYGVLRPLITFLSDSPTHSNDLKYWTLLLVHQLSLTETLHKSLVRHGFIALLAKMTRLSFGNTNMQKLCLHSLVRLLSNLESTEASKQLAKLIELNMVSLIASCLKNDDMELVSWAVFLMQEFVMKDYARTAFSQVRGVLKVLSSLLATEEGMGIPRIVLRTLKCLGIRNDQFQMEMIRSGIVKRIVPCLKNTDEETQYWALVRNGGECHQQFLDEKGLEILIEMTKTSNLHLSLYISDIYIFLCSAVDTTDEIVKKLIDAGGITVLSKLVFDGARDDIQAVSCKCLVTISRKESALRNSIYQTTILPLSSKISSMVETRDISSALVASLYSFYILLQPNISPYGVAMYSHVGKDPRRLTGHLVNLLAMSAVRRDEFDNRLIGVLEAEQMEDIADLWAAVDGVETTLKESLVSRAAAAIAPLYRKGWRERFQQAKLLEILLASILVRETESCYHIILLLALISKHGFSRSTFLRSGATLSSFKVFLLSMESSLQFYCRNFLDSFTDCTTMDDDINRPNESFLMLDILSMTSYLTISSNLMEVRNDSWTFESIRANWAVTGTGRFAFEIELTTAGIIQDDENSYAYDGHRQRKWHGTNITSNDYGQEWKVGDVITALIDLDAGHISYLINGVSLGVAFEEVEKNLYWYPGVSLAAGQGCIFFFGNSMDPMRHLPDGYLPITSVFAGASSPSPLPVAEGITPTIDEREEDFPHHEDSATTTTSEGSMLRSQMAADADWSLALAFGQYFEVQVGIPPEGSNLDWQIGMYNRDMESLILLPLTETTACLLKVDREDPEESILLHTLNVVAKVTVETGEESDALQLVQKLSDFSVRDGDYLGCGFLASKRALRFTRNGKFICASDEWFPYIRNFRRYRLNFGLVPFKGTTFSFLDRDD
ncbi:hypothetical protein HK101_007565 [Irineochytrium annulatum]|nr:hypothetical protein HK101_007565 [Irineochytrium annulatum]